MGMYTGLRGYIELMPNIVKRLKEATDEDFSYWEEEDEWEYVLEQYKEVPSVDHLLTATARLSYIPFGGINYMPDQWEEANRPATLRNNVLRFTTSLKDYDNEIESFIAVLPLIATDWFLEELYEESDISTLYQYPDTKGEDYIDYRDDDNGTKCYA